MLGGMKSEPPSCPLSPSCWCLKLIGGVGSFTRLGSLWVWSKEQLELATGLSVCDAAQGGCQWENLSVGRTLPLCLFLYHMWFVLIACLLAFKGSYRVQRSGSKSMFFFSGNFRFVQVILKKYIHGILVILPQCWLIWFMANDTLTNTF